MLQERRTTKLKDSQNQTPLNEENFAEIIKEKLDEAYKKGYNDACEIVGNSFLANKDKFGNPHLSSIMVDVANTIKKCKLGD